jgi:hypothetical protein
MNFKVKELNLTSRTVLVDWGWVKTSHPLPQAIVDNPRMDLTLMREEILKLQPVPPENEHMTPQLRALIEQGPNPVVTADHYPNYEESVSNQLRERTF